MSSKLRRGTGKYFHWCPACEEIHSLPDNWQFNGDLENPTFSPSFKHEGFKTVKKDGVWTGEWERDAGGNCIPFICHYNLTAGQLCFAGDSTHAFADKIIPLPELPAELTDAAFLL